MRRYSFDLTNNNKITLKTKTMKQTLFAALLGLATLTAATASAQSISRFAVASQTPAEVYHLPEVNAAAETPAPAVNAKVLAAFNKSFKGTNASWFTLEDKYLVRFSKNGRSTHALYKRNGQMVYSVTKGSADLLPLSTKHIINEVYGDYDITSVAEATSQGITAHMAHLQLGHSLLVIKVIDNEIVEEKRYTTKAK